MTGIEYEKTVAKYLRNNGYTHVEVTKASGDYGVDVTAHKRGKKYAVQCKYYSGPVSLSSVQEAVAGKTMYNCDYAMVVTNSSFTASAKELAKANGVMLLENVVTEKSRFKLKYLLWVLAGVYVFIASAAFSAAFDAIRQQPFWTALYNVVTFVPVITAPFLLWLIIKLIKKKSKNKSAAKNTTSGPVVPALLESEPVTSAQTEAIMCADTEKICKLLYDNSYFVNNNDVDKLVSSETITVTRIQKALKYGYAKAARLIDTLLENGYITETTDKHIYTWSYKAK